MQSPDFSFISLQPSTINNKKTHGITSAFSIQLQDMRAMLISLDHLPQLGVKFMEHNHIQLTGRKKRIQSKIHFPNINAWKDLPSRELTYPTLGKGKSSSKCHFWGIC